MGIEQAFASRVRDTPMWRRAMEMASRFHEVVEPLSLRERSASMASREPGGLLDVALKPCVTWVIIGRPRAGEDIAKWSGSIELERVVPVSIPGAFALHIFETLRLILREPSEHVQRLRDAAATCRERARLERSQGLPKALFEQDMEMAATCERTAEELQASDLRMAAMVKPDGQK